MGGGGGKRREDRWETVCIINEKNKKLNKKRSINSNIQKSNRVPRLSNNSLDISESLEEKILNVLQQRNNKYSM